MRANASDPKRLSLTGPYISDGRPSWSIRLGREIIVSPRNERRARDIYKALQGAIEAARMQGREEAFAEINAEEAGK